MLGIDDDALVWPTSMRLAEIAQVGLWLVRRRLRAFPWSRPGDCRVSSSRKRTSTKQIVHYSRPYHRLIASLHCLLREPFTANRSETTSTPGSITISEALAPSNVRRKRRRWGEPSELVTIGSSSCSIAAEIAVRRRYSASANKYAWAGSRSGYRPSAPRRCPARAA